MLSMPKVFRDPVHVNIELSRTDSWDRLAFELIQTPQVQRLRRVRQLGLASLVYHGAEHSRFVHTLGVAHLAKRLYLASARNSGREPDERELLTVVASAVLHDTGHPPFSHAVEKELGVGHEKATVHLLTSDTEVRRTLLRFGDESFIQAVAGHIDGSTDAVTVDLISSQLDADRMDYVLRDGYYAGVPNAQFDVERIVQMVQRDEKGICFDRRAQYAIEGYFTARYHLYLQLYFHKTVRASEAMLRAIIRRAGSVAKAGGAMGQINPSLITLLRERRIEASVLVSDADLWAAFAIWANSSDDKVLRDLSRRLLDRDLFRAVDFDVKSVPKLYDKLLPAAREIAATAGFDPDYYVLVDTHGDSPYKFADYDAVESVRIVDPAGKSLRLETLSGLVSALQGEAYQNIRCCLPLEIREQVLTAWKEL